MQIPPLPDVRCRLALAMALAVPLQLEVEPFAGASEPVSSAAAMTIELPTAISESDLAVLRRWFPGESDADLTNAILAKHVYGFVTAATGEGTLEFECHQTLTPRFVTGRPMLVLADGRLLGEGVISTIDERRAVLQWTRAADAEESREVRRGDLVYDKPLEPGSRSAAPSGTTP